MKNSRTKIQATKADDDQGQDQGKDVVATKKKARGVQDPPREEGGAMDVVSDRSNNASHISRSAEV